MKKILIVAIALLLSACQTTPKVVKVEVWSPPTINMPTRPKLQSDGKGTDGEIARKLSNDLTNMEEYTFKLENQLRAIRVQSGVNKSQTLDNNK
jgi:hypothetical protein